MFPLIASTARKPVFRIPCGMGSTQASCQPSGHVSPTVHLPFVRPALVLPISTKAAVALTDLYSKVRTFKDKKRREEKKKNGGRLSKKSSTISLPKSREKSKGEQTPVPRILITPLFSALNALRRKSRDSVRPRDLKKPRRSLRIFAHATIMLMRKAKSLQLINREDEHDMIPYVTAFSTLIVKEESEEDGLVFRKSKFKANKELLVLPTKALKILDNRFRSDEEITFLCRCLRVLKRFNEYPESVQERIASKLILQQFGEKRIILREGHRPEGMYFVVYGTAVELAMNFDGNTARPSFLVAQGDVFGETALVQGIPRPKTWISQTPITLLYLRTEDYFLIFNIGDSLRMAQADEDMESSKLFEFLRTIPWFQKWPLHLLQTNRSKHSYRMYKKGEIIDPHAGSSPWLYIVISGSISVTKKLQKTRPNDFDNENKMFIIGGSRNGMLKLDYTRQIGIHEEWFDRFYVEFEMAKKHQLQRAYQRRLGVRLATIQELMALEGETAGAQQDDIAVQKIKALSELVKEEDGKDEDGEKKKDMSIGQLNLIMMLKLLGKGLNNNFDQQSDGTESVTTAHQRGSARGGGEGGDPAIGDSSETASTWPEISRENTSSILLRSRKNTQDLHQAKVATSLPNIEDLRHQVVLEIETLQRGQMFGGAHIVHDNQPDVGLMTNNGAEVFLLDKELFRKNASDILLNDMVKAISPYPSDSQLQYRLQTFTDWKQYRLDVLDSALISSGAAIKSVPELPKIKTK